METGDFKSSSSFLVQIPCCCVRQLKFRKRGFVGRILQGLLLLVLCVTVIFNIVFIVDNSKRLRKSYNKNELSSNGMNGLELDLDNDVILEKKDIGGGPEQALSKRIKIEAHSSKDLVYVSIDGLRVYENAASEESARGMHIVVLNEVTGSVMATRIFDTYTPKEDEAMILFLNILQEGRIVIFMVKDEASARLRKPGKSSIKMFGSKLIDDLGWRGTWAFISAKRDTWYAEALQRSPSASQWGSAVVVQAILSLKPVKDSCKWEEDQGSEQRREFCDRYEGYGSVCSCLNPAPIRLAGKPLSGKIMDVPVAVIASNRPHYLYRMLRGLLTVPGANPKMTTVYIDGFFDEPMAVAKLFGINSVQHTPICSKNCRISQHYRRTLTETFHNYPDAPYMIILEEDLDVAKDIFDYFNQLLPILEQDESLYCVSAWNDQGYEHSSNDPSMLYRVETMPGLGWVLKRKLYKEELEGKWPGPDKYWDWDMWMRMDDNRKGRECIIPDISRTYHFGAKGLNMNSFFQDLYFTKHALNTATNIKFDVEKVRKENYEKEMEELIKNATVLDHSKNPCTHENFVPGTTGKTYVVYMRMDHFADWQTWLSIAKCYKLWDLDVRGFHKSAWRFWIKQNHIILVGVPTSPYSKFKPNDVTPLYMPKKKEEKT